MSINEVKVGSLIRVKVGKNLVETEITGIMPDGLYRVKSVNTHREFSVRHIHELVTAATRNIPDVAPASEVEAVADALVVSGLHRLFKPEKPIFDLMAAKMGGKVKIDLEGIMQRTAEQLGIDPEDVVISVYAISPYGYCYSAAVIGGEPVSPYPVEN